MYFERGLPYTKYPDDIDVCLTATLQTHAQWRETSVSLLKLLVTKEPYNYLSSLNGTQTCYVTLMCKAEHRNVLDPRKTGRGAMLFK